MSITT